MNTSAAESNIELATRMLNAFGSGDMATLAASFAPDAVWEFPGDSVLNGTFVGPEQIVGFLARSFELSGGTIAAEVIDILGSDRGVAHVQHIRAQRDGRTLDAVEVLAHEVRDGRIVRTYHRSDSPAITAFFGHA